MKRCLEIIDWQPRAYLPAFAVGNADQDSTNGPDKGDGEDQPPQLESHADGAEGFAGNE